MNNIVPIDKLIESIPVERRTEELISKVKRAYEIEVEQMNSYAKHATQPELTMGTFRSGGSQLLAEFWVNDLDRPVKPEQLNWHMQNTSQWQYAGCILIEDNGNVSRHH